jgi:hypothetical protein
MPDSLLLPSESANGWATTKSAGPAFEKALGLAGWTLFFLAGPISTNVFGFDKQKTLRSALRQLITKVKAHKCNGIEITDVTYKSFLKVPYVSVSAHLRHVQKGLVFDGAATQPAA